MLPTWASGRVALPKSHVNNFRSNTIGPLKVQVHKGILYVWIKPHDYEEYDFKQYFAVAECYQNVLDNLKNVKRWAKNTGGFIYSEDKFDGYGAPDTYKLFSMEDKLDQFKALVRAYQEESQSVPNLKTSFELPCYNLLMQFPDKWECYGLYYSTTDLLLQELKNLDEHNWFPLLQKHSGQNPAAGLTEHANKAKAWLEWKDK